MNLYKEYDARKIEQMFSKISARYDLLNHILSFGLDTRWRKRAALETRKFDCKRILDVCTGTADMAIELCKHWQGKTYIEGVDFSRELIEIGMKKIEKAGFAGTVSLREADAEVLPYKDDQFDAITIAFGLRNINRPLKALKEFYRVAKPGGCFVCLEFSQPTNPLFNKFYSFYLMKLVPLFSAVFGSDPSAYRYLGKTIKNFPPPLELANLIKSAGWKDVTYYTLSWGIVSIHKGVK